MTYDELVEEIRNLVLEHDAALVQERQIWHDSKDNVMPERVSEHCSKSVIVMQGGIYSIGYYNYKWHEWVVQSPHVDNPECWMDFKRKEV